jgi:thioredoxin-like negative regulator of GroEL
MLEINKTPTLILVNNGDIIDSIKGLPSTDELSLFFGSLNKILSLRKSKKEIEFLMKTVYDHYEQKDFKSALDIVEALEEYELDKRSKDMIELVKIDCLIQVKMKQEARNSFIELKKNLNLETEEQEIQDFVQKIENELNVKEDDEDFILLKQKYEQNMEDLEIGFNLAVKARDVEKYELAVELLLFSIQMDKKWEDGIALKELTSLLNDLGSGNELAKKARKDLAMLLY